ncbi:hypothetical protein PCS_02946 [Desulfocurvibacter africanus PCS]|uniref:Lipoprotein n=2 Tax=Desulfocurvibacter africanus TaxID=873 RepID=M5Q067_DESAF|nr:hypothetical protein PCS_02946 [Desulfocurvibacter africanus PCS]
MVKAKPSPAFGSAVFILALFALTLTGCAGFRPSAPEWARDIDLAEFVGPQPDMTHVFAGPNGVRLEATGLKVLSGGRGVLVEERTMIPADLTDTGLPEVLSRQVTFMAKGKALKLVEDGEATTVLDLSGEPWRMPVETSPPMPDSALVCRATKIAEAQLFGRKRKVISVECVGDFEGVSLYEQRSYAQGLGPIFLYFGEGGEDAGGFRLVEVREAGGK